MAGFAAQPAAGTRAPHGAPGRGGRQYGEPTAQGAQARNAGRESLGSKHRAEQFAHLQHKELVGGKSVCPGLEARRIRLILILCGGCSNATEGQTRVGHRTCTGVQWA